MKQKNKIWFYPFLIMGLSLVLTSSCKKDDNSTSQIPTLTTTTVSNVAATTAKSGGTISDDGGATITARGVCWSTAQSPTISNSKTSDGTGIGSYTSSISGLTANTTYYARAYATNSEGTAYGNQVTFTSTAPANNSLSATVDGVQYIATSFNISTISGRVGIAGMNGTKNLILWLPDPFTTGSHSLSTFGDYMGQYFPNTSNTYTSTSGTNNITSYNSTTGEIKGTFNFIGTFNSATVTVTNGQYDVFK